MICKYCGTVNGENAKFCHGCGKKIEAETQPRRCPFCSGVVKEDAVFCRNCGSKLTFAEEEFAFQESPLTQSDPDLPGEIYQVDPAEVDNNDSYYPYNEQSISDDTVIVEEKSPESVPAELTPDDIEDAIPVSDTLVLDRSALHNNSTSQTADTALDLEDSSLETQSQQPEMVCPSCGNPLRPGIRFCGVCGIPVSQSTEAQGPQPQQNSAEERTAFSIPIEELRKMKALLDEDIITQDEFDQLKKKLLKID